METNIPTPDQLVDASGLTCPLPILRAKKALSQMQSGEILKVITTDDHAAGDFQAFCAQSGNELLAQKQLSNNVTEHYLKRR